MTAMGALLLRGHYVSPACLLCVSCVSPACLLRVSCVATTCLLRVRAPKPRLGGDQPIQSSALPANTRIMDEASVLDECALELLKSLFNTSCSFEAGSGRQAAWMLGDLRTRACAPDQLERVARQLLRALLSERTELESMVSNERAYLYTIIDRLFTGLRVSDVPRAT